MQKKYRKLLLGLRRETEQEFLNRGGNFVEHLPEPKIRYVKYGNVLSIIKAKAKAVLANNA
ncbi:hypothetical protein OAS39_13575 [Pirellulales bacterium]|nr:hypothetical protein [Pirellulales bacterium]